MVHHLLVQQRGHEGHQPLLEAEIEELRIVLDVYLCGQCADGVRGPVPDRQFPEVVLEGIEQLGEFRLDDGAYVRGTCGLHLLGALHPQGVHLAVGQFRELAVLRGHLAASRHHVLAEPSPVAEEVFYLGHRGQLGFLPVVLASGSRQLQGPVLFGLLVAGAQDAGDVPVVVGKPFPGPLGGRLLRDAVGVEQVAGAHDVLVAVVWHILHALLSQFAFDGLQDPFQLSGRRVFLPGWWHDFHGERRGLGIEVDIRVVRQAAQAGDVLALLVKRMSQQRGIVPVDGLEGIGMQERGVDGTGIVRMAVRVCADDAQARSADGDMGQQGMRVVAHQLHAFSHPFRRQVVEVRQAQPGMAADVLLAFPAPEAYRHRKAGAVGFLPPGRLRLLVFQVVAVFSGMLGNGRIVADQLHDVFQGHFGGTGVRIAFEKAQGCFLVVHN